MPWTSPTGHNDPDNKWSWEVRAYDEDTNSSAYTTIPGLTLGSWLELTHSAIYCNKIRFNAGYLPAVTRIFIDVYYSGGWHTVVSSYDYPDHVWVEKDIPGGTQLVTKARVRFHNVYTESWNCYLYEFDFGEVTIAYTDTATRFRLWAQAYQDVATRFGLSSQAYQDITTRFKLEVLAYEDTTTRFILIAPNYQDIAARFRLIIQSFIDTDTRFKLLPLAHHKDVSTRFFLHQPTWEEFQMQKAVAALKARMTGLGLEPGAHFRI